MKALTNSNQSNEVLIKKVASYIKDKRITKNITQDELAQYSGFSKSSVARFESGKGNISLNNLFSIMKILGIVDNFMSIFEEEESPLLLAKAGSHKKKQRGKK